LEILILCKSHEVTIFATLIFGKMWLLLLLLFKTVTVTVTNINVGDSNCRTLVLLFACSSLFDEAGW
jgi:hypothetical protein